MQIKNILMSCISSVDVEFEVLFYCSFSFIRSIIAMGWCSSSWGVHHTLTSSSQELLGVNLYQIWYVATVG